MWFSVALNLFLLTASLVEQASPLNDVCYGHLGCFSMKAPWFSPVRPLPRPQRPEDINTQFSLHHRDQPAGFKVTKLPSLNLTGSGFNGSKPTVFIIHGFLSNSSWKYFHAMKNVFLREMDANVFLVDWSSGATQINYLQVASNTRVVAAEVIRLTKYLLNHEGTNASRFHLVGHSLGAHISGYVGKAVPGVARITALDAAQPAFEGFPAVVRVTNKDAAFVEAFHTNARPFLPTLGFGYMAPIGHVDFYVNGGWDQPGCALPPAPNIGVNSLDDLGKVTIEAAFKWGFCAHIRSGLVYTAAARHKNRCVIWGHKGEYLKISLSIMSGGHVSQLMTFDPCSVDTCYPLGQLTSIFPARGVFLVKTTGRDPYCAREIVSRSFKNRFRLGRK